MSALIPFPSLTLIVSSMMSSSWFFPPQALLEGLKELDWPEKVKTMQEHWISKSEGAYFDFPIVTATQVKPPRMHKELMIIITHCVRLLHLPHPV